LPLREGSERMISPDFAMVYAYDPPSAPYAKNGII